MKTLDFIFNRIFFPMLAGILLAISVNQCIELTDCRKFTMPSQVCDTVFVHTWDTILKEIPVIIPKPYAVVKIDTIQVDIDTMEIMRDYYSRYYYIDTIADTNLMAILRETITENRIMDRQFSYSILRVPEIHNTVIVDNSSGFFLGGGLNLNNGELGLNINSSYLDKKGRIYGLQYDPLNNLWGASCQVKIGFKKRTPR